MNSMSLKNRPQYDNAENKTDRTPKTNSAVTRSLFTQMINRYCFKLWQRRMLEKTVYR